MSGKKMVKVVAGVSTGLLFTSTISNSHLIAHLARTHVVHAEENTDDKYAWMPDENLRMAIEKQLEIAEGTLEQKNLEQVKTLDLNEKGIVNIEGLGFAKNLNELYLQSNFIKDISELNDLTKLQRLNLENNQISDITALKDLPSLNYLLLGNNQISDIAALSNNTSLLRLFLNNNQISDITPLKNLNKLLILDLDNNQVNDISVLNNSVELVYLFLSNNQISDITALKNKTDLMRLYLTNNQVSDISVLENLYLHFLYLDNNQIRDISALKNMRRGKELCLDNNQITNFDYLDEISIDWKLSLGTQNRKLDELNIEKSLDGNISIDYSSLFGETSDIEYLGNGDFNEDNYVLTVSEEELSDGIIKSQFELTGKIKNTEYTSTVNIEQPIVFKTQSPIIHVKDQTVDFGSDWNNEMGFDGATDKYGLDVDFDNIESSAPVNTKEPGEHEVSYWFKDNPEKEFVAKITVREDPENPGSGILEWMPDKNLQNAIEKQLGISEGKLEQKHLEGVETLDLNEKGIVSIEGLGFAKNLQTLSLNDNEISNISGLNNLSSLRIVSLNNNKISDISVLKNLPSLYNVSLKNNKISDISGLNNFPLLNILLLQNNQITNFDVLDDLNGNITKVSLGVQDVTLDELIVVKEKDGSISIDYDSLFGKKSGIKYVGDGFDKETRILKIPAEDFSNGIIDLQFELFVPVGERINGATINIKQPVVFKDADPDSDISTWMPDKNLQNAIKEQLGGKELTQDNLKEVKFLDLTEKNIENLEGLEFAESLTNLNLSDNQISDITALENLKKLVHLFLENNQVSDITTLKTD